MVIMLIMYDLNMVCVFVECVGVMECGVLVEIGNMVDVFVVFKYLYMICLFESCL